MIGDLRGVRDEDLNNDILSFQLMNGNSVNHFVTHYKQMPWILSSDL